MHRYSFEESAENTEYETFVDIKRGGINEHEIFPNR